MVLLQTHLPIKVFHSLHHLYNTKTAPSKDLKHMLILKKSTMFNLTTEGPSNMDYKGAYLRADVHRPTSLPERLDRTEYTQYRFRILSKQKLTALVRAENDSCEILSCMVCVWVQADLPHIPCFVSAPG
jgi:hypothetical protein